MLRRGKIAAILAGVMLLVIGMAQIACADESVTGLVVESGFSGVVVRAGGQDVKYNTGKETVYTPADYRPVKGDTITLAYYAKAQRSGGEVLAVSSLTLVSMDPNRKELTSPASGVIREVGRKNLRIEFPESAQVVSMEMKRDMETVPAGWQAAAGAKVTVSFDKVKSRFGNSVVMVINKLEKAD